MSPHATLFIEYFFLVTAILVMITSIRSTFGFAFERFFRRAAGAWTAVGKSHRLPGEVRKELSMSGNAPACHSNRFFLKVILLGMICGMTLSTWPAIGTAAESEAPHARFALLIGVGKYAHLSEGEQLGGSGNDVEAMRQLLVERFGFHPKNVTTLIDDQATGQNIRAAIQALIDMISKLPAGGPPAQVVVHFSGHGSQIPDQPDGPDHDEDDGLDETWVPYDSTKQGGEQDIRDDEINSLVSSICQDGQARLLIVADCCHSGTGARGTTKTRKLNREVRPTVPSANAVITRKRLPEGAVFLSACRAQEREPEFQDDSKTYGLLTRFLVETLNEEQSVSRLSYDLLQRSIVGRYQRDRRVMQAPIPQLEGSVSALQSTILGFGTDVDRPPYYEVEAEPSLTQVVIRAGKFHNISVGSFFELYASAEQTSDASASLAWLKVTKVDGTTSEAQVIRWEDSEQAKSIKDRLPKSFKKGYAILRQLATGDSGVRLRVVRATGKDQDGPAMGPGDPLLPKMISNALTGVSRPGETPWLHWIEDPAEPCDLVLRLDGDYASLFPATGVAEVVESTTRTRGDIPESLRGGWGPIDLRTGTDSSEPPQTIPDYLRRITKARNLLSLAQGGAGTAASDYNVKFELLRVDGTATEKRVAPWPPDSEGVVSMRQDEAYAFRVTNQQTDGKPIYVTVLEISPSMGIQVVMPYEVPEVKLAPGDSVTSDDFVCSAPHGAYQSVLLVTREPADFQFVAQADLPKTRGALLAGGAGTLTDQLAELTHFQVPKTRGTRVRRKSTGPAWHSDVLSWRTSP